MPNGSDFLLLAGSGNPELAKKIAKYLDRRLVNVEISKNSDGEKRIRIKENIRRKIVYIIQPTCAPVDENIIELLILIASCNSSQAAEIIPVIPYFGYARQDKKVESRVPITAKVVASMIDESGAKKIIATDLHSLQIQGFFKSIPDNLSCWKIFLKYIQENFSDDVKIVSPDAGGANRAREFAKKISNEKIAIVDKNRAEANQASAMNLIGDVSEKIAIIFDDMVDTAGTLKEASEILIENGAKSVYAMCTHPVLSGPAIERIEESKLTKLIVTDTIPLSEEAEKCEKIEVLSMSEIIAQAIRRDFFGESVSNLFL